MVDDDGKEVAHNGKVAGEIILKGDAVCKGYWNMPEETEGTIKDGWFYTGDIATIDEDGYIYIAGRKKDIIVSGGVNIASVEIEEVLCTHPAVSQCAVIGVPDERWGETPKAVVVLKEGMHATEKDIMDFCKQNLASFKKVTSVEFVDSLPMTPSGKILKRQIREKYGKKGHQIARSFQ